MSGQWAAVTENPATLVVGGSDAVVSAAGPFAQSISSEFQGAVAQSLRRPRGFDGLQPFQRA